MRASVGGVSPYVRSLAEWESQPTGRRITPRALGEIAFGPSRFEIMIVREWHFSDSRMDSPRAAVLRND